MGKFDEVSSRLQGARFDPGTISELVEAKMEDCKLATYEADGDLKPFRKQDPHYGESSMDGLGKILTELFPGLILTDTKVSSRRGELDLIQLILVGSPLVIYDPESHMDPDILKILHAKRSAQEMRKDDGK